tara:strand:- start:31585 stop:31893 length:309 start_codon:yes stop_codon:yes gene_type:complete
VNINRLEKLEEFLASNTNLFYQSLSLLVNIRLIELKWSTRDLAEAMDVSLNTVQRIRAGKVTSNMKVGTFFRLLHALDYDLPIEYLDMNANYGDFEFDSTEN